MYVRKRMRLTSHQHSVFLGTKMYGSHNAVCVSDHQKYHWHCSVWTPQSAEQTCQLLRFECSLLCSVDAYYGQVDITTFSRKKNHGWYSKRVAFDNRGREIPATVSKCWSVDFWLAPWTVRAKNSMTRFCLMLLSVASFALWASTWCAFSFIFFAVHSVCVYYQISHTVLSGLYSTSLCKAHPPVKTTNKETVLNRAPWHIYEARKNWKMRIEWSKHKM